MYTNNTQHISHTSDVRMDRSLNGRSLVPTARPRPRSTPQLPMRSYEFCALQADGSLFVEQGLAPAVPLFENAFSAFAHGTLFQTVNGNVPVEDLQPGDMIVRADGETVPLVWIGSSNFVPADTGRRTPLIRVMGDSLGPGRPTGFQTFGPAARIFYTPQRLRGTAPEKENFTLVRDLVDGVNIIEIQPPTPVRLYHIALAQHAAITVSGLQVETFHPGPETLRNIPADLRDRFLDIFPHIKADKDFGPLMYPRTQQTPSAA